MKYLALIFLAAALLTGCQVSTPPAEPAPPAIAVDVQDGIAQQAVEECQKVCQQARQQKIDLSAGPCLRNAIIVDWVCDVAHSPRQPVDNNSDNQCTAFRQGIAHHFVEVDESCMMITAY